MSNKSKLKKDNRPPEHMRTLKIGDIRDDGMVFVGYRRNAKNGEYWAPKEVYQKIVDKRRAKDNRPPKHLRNLKRGDVREDGMVFWRYNKQCPNGEAWATKESFDISYDKAKRNLELLRERNPSWNNEYMKKWREIPENKLAHNQRKRVIGALKGIAKSNNALEMIGCSAIELKDYIESKFQDGMSWKNYGLDGWHVDHIRPCASFDLSDPSQQEECFHYTNLQPLWAKDNLSKGSYYNPQTED